MSRPKSHFHCGRSIKCRAQHYFLSSSCVCESPHRSLAPIIMGASASPDPGPAADSGPSTLEIVIGILALFLALAAVVVAIIQVRQARATAGDRQTDRESQTAIELSRTSTTQQAPAPVLADSPTATVSRRYFTTLRRFSYDADFALKSNR
jgi:hypothetical protein